MVRIPIFVTVSLNLTNGINGSVINLRLRINQNGFRPQRTTVAQILALRSPNVIFSLLFADDSNVFLAGKNPDDLVDTMNVRRNG